ncbi:MAG TPA: 2'-5' RNA ligase family protein [Blastocatellia bacterium]|nr:2'-5' RNA ligase family protein [Blastocatellia bacterium]
MFYTLVHYPAIDTRRINRLRSKYDPQADLIAPHITIVFPAPEPVGEQSLAAHISTVLRRWEPFPIRLNGLGRSWDDCLFLTLEEGGDNIIRLHDELYTGALAHYHSSKVQFIPHLTLGVFTSDPGRYEQASKEAESSGLDYSCVLDKVNLVKVDGERTQVVWSREFLL